jgi:hypothetical protein
MGEVEDLALRPFDTLNSDALESPLKSKSCRFGHRMRKLFLFDEQYINLNHGTPPFLFHLVP